jgi:hypothetical protein
VIDDVRDIPTTTDVPDPEPHTWQPANLIQLAANPPEPPTIGGLLYPGKRTVLSEKPRSMKTWLALILCKAELDIGLPVCWVDLDAMGPGAMLERLQLLGVTDEQIGDFLYYEPSQMLDKAMLDEITATIASRGIRLFVIDAFNPILGLLGFDYEKTRDVEQFWRTVADPICRAGAAPVLLDHVVKNADNRGKYSHRVRAESDRARSSTSASSCSSRSDHRRTRPLLLSSTRTAPATCPAPPSAGSSSPPTTTDHLRARARQEPRRDRRLPPHRAYGTDKQTPRAAARAAVENDHRRAGSGEGRSPPDSPPDARRRRLREGRTGPEKGPHLHHDPGISGGRRHTHI